MSEIVLIIIGWIIVSSIISPFLGKLLASNRKKYESSQDLFHQELMRQVSRKPASSRLSS